MLRSLNELQAVFLSTNTFSFQVFSAYVNQLMVNWWLGLVVWIPGSPVDRKGLGVLKGTPIRGPQITNLSLVDLVVDYRG